MEMKILNTPATNTKNTIHSVENKNGKNEMIDNMLPNQPVRFSIPNPLACSTSIKSQ